MPPRPRSLRDCLHLFLSGFLMGTADLVPGISGGTMALITGIYENFIQSLCTFNYSALLNAFKGRFSSLAWQYLGMILFGMGVAIFSLAPLFHFFLNDPVYRSYLFSLFLGLILSSTIYCFRKVSLWNLITISAFFLGAAIAFVITMIPMAFPFDFFSHEYGFQLILVGMFFSGLLAVCAMLLPGISGSYILNIIGAYPIIIEALASMTTGWQWKSVSVILSMGFGVLVGGLIFSRFIRWLLKSYHNITISSMVGFMLGALPAVWPFWDYGMSQGKLIPTVPLIPEVTAPEFWFSFVFFAIGCLIVLLVERGSYVLKEC